MLVKLIVQEENPVALQSENATHC